MTGEESRYDVFISYSHYDNEWVWNWLVPRLRQEGLRVCVDRDCFELGEPTIQAIERAITTSRKTVLIVTPEYLRSQWTDFEHILTRTVEIGQYQYRLIPLVLRSCDLPLSIRALTYADFAGSGEEEFQIQRLVASILDKPLPPMPLEKIARDFSKKTISANAKFRRILVLCPLFGASRIFYSELLDAILGRAKKFNYQLIIQPVDVRNKKPLQDYYGSLRGLDGIIAITCQVEDTSWLEECKVNHLPLVLIHDNISETKLKESTVVSFLRPQLNALDELVSHLIKDHHCKNICVVMISEREHLIRQQKLDIIRKTMKQSRLTFDERTQLFHITEYSHREGRRIVENILDVNSGVDAIVSLADVTAIGITQELRERGYGHVLVTGFDNIELAEHFDLTSIDQQLKTTGERALLDLNNAISNDVFVLERITYIPTTLVKRSSCCVPNKLLFATENLIQRFAIYYVINNKRTLNAVDKMRSKVYELQRDDLDTIKLLGKAPLFPLHITIKGIFQLLPERKLRDFLAEVENTIAVQRHFLITVMDLMNFPTGTLSFGFDSKSVEQLRKLQQAILPVVNQYRNAHIVEPEFRKYLNSSNKTERDHTLNFGEPFVHDLFIPHMTIVSGIQNESDYMAIKELIDISNLEPIEMSVDKLSVLYETTLGGNWQILDEFNLD